MASYMNYITTLEEIDRLAEQAKPEGNRPNRIIRTSASNRSVKTSNSRRSTSSNKRNIGFKIDYVPTERCDDPTCAICSGPPSTSASERPETSHIHLRDIGLDENVYPFSKRLAQLDSTINMLTQILDQRLRDERYRDAQDLSEILRELVGKRQKCQQLLDERRGKLGDLLEAQRLKNEYDTLIWNAVDINRLRRHLTVAQLVDLERLRRF
ncbi:unnamed protein product [Bursaphelenchus okinawaensis]|uniref:Uncharacterized protein n=1 Tax=Bursaphelenchus okinawaensis TaxID=465554 RepID=A0A811KHV2_9BILA|nr:unnamed protein product [Bursaphelenchus okinawaensis]CAG9102721.1 unnamed protein product [Bursaphelenchus okinawaensis]